MAVSSSCISSHNEGYFSHQETGLIGTENFELSNFHRPLQGRGESLVEARIYHSSG